MNRDYLSGLAVILCVCVTLVFGAAPADAERLIVDPESTAWSTWAALGARDMSIKKRARVEGDLHAAGNLDLASEVVVTGDASSERRVQGPGEGGVLGDVTDFADPISLPALPTTDELRAMADRVLTGDQRWDDDVVIDDILFVDGKVEIRGALDGQGTLIAARDLKINRGTVALAAGTSLSIIALGKLDVEDDRELRAFIRAARDVSFKKRTRLEGVLIADGKIDLGEDSVLSFLPPASPSLQILAPREGDTLGPDAEPAELRFSALDPGLDVASLEVLLDGVDRTAEAVITGGVATLDLGALAAGPHTLTASIRDLAGELATAEVNFVFDPNPPSARLIVDPDSPAWSRWAVLGDRDVKAKKEVLIEGSVHAGGNLDLDRDVVITGDASAERRVQGQGASGVQGETFEFVDPVALPVLPSKNDLRELADRVLTGDQRWTDDVVIDDVLFVDGKLDIEGALDGQGTLIAARDLKIKRGPTSIEPDTLLSIIALGKLDVDEDRELRAFVRAARDVNLKRNTRFEGVLIADGKIDLGDDSVLTFLAQDSAPPRLEILSPRPGAVLGAGVVTVSLTFSDDDSGLDAASLAVQVDGVDRTADLAISAGSATLELNSLAAGAHRITASVRDVAGNLTEAEVSFSVDLGAPAVSFVDPAPGAVLINIGAPTVVLSLADDVAVSGVRLVLDPDTAAVDLSLTCVQSGDSATCALPPIAAGAHVLLAEAFDGAGNAATATAAFEILEDRSPPRLEVVGPEGTLYNESSPAVSVSFLDGDSGIDPATLDVRVDGVALSGCTLSADGAVCPTPSLGAGPHTIAASLADRVGLVAEASGAFDIVLDTDPPTLAFTAPEPGPRQQTESEVEVSLAFADAGSGLDLGSLAFTIDGVLETFPCEVSESGAGCNIVLADGAHTLAAEIRDLAGNLASASLALELVVDAEPPTLEILSPTADLPRGETSTLIEISAADAGVGLDPSTLSIRLDGRELASTCTLAGGASTCTVDGLSEGTHALVVRQADFAGSFARVARTFAVTFSDREPPALEIASPAAGQVVGLADVEVAYADETGLDLQTLIVRFDGEELVCVAGPDSATCAVADVPAGPHTVTAEIRDLEGNRSLADVAFDLELQLPVAIDAPIAGAMFRTPEITVTGTAGGDDLAGHVITGVDVAGVEATVAGDGSWQATVSLHEGANQLTAVARSDLGGIGTASVRVVLDTEAPRPVILTPPDGLVTTSPQIVVAGDILTPNSSATRQDASEVEVLGLVAEVEQRAFVRENVLLVPGENPIEVVARDAAGNVGRDLVTITYLPNPARRLDELLGNGQRGRVGERLEDPLVVQAVDSFGTPLPGREIVFEVTRGDGQVVADPDSGRTLRVRTDSNGIAQVGFVLGRRSGEGNHEVTATSPGLEGALLFCASADPVEPERIVRIVGDTHLGALRAAVDAEAPFPLRAQVFDALGNPLVGVPVTFRVDRGGGQLLDSAGDRLAEAVVSTDAEGRAQMRFVLGPEVGVDSHRVKADFFGLTSLPAVFSITGVTPGPESETRVGGVVLDNEDEPVPGATVRVLADGLADPPEAITDADGRFEIAGAPVGTVDLEVDGTTTTRAGRWPVLHYVFDTIAGTRNDIGMPVRLLPIDSGAIVGGDQDVTIPIAGVAGGELTIFANSATFPDGSTVGEVSVTQVHGDKVPMLPPMGSSFMLAWTVQPPGTRFDPPAQISIPNMGDSPGAVVDIFSFDHDLGEFVPIGTATVSDDGTRVTSNRGSGVVKAGWHGCVPPPLDPTDICQPSSCKQCNADGELEPLCEEDCETCDDGTCTPRRFESLTVLGLGSDGEDSEDTIVVGVNQTVDFDRRAEENCKDEEYEWDLGDGESASGKTAEHAYDEPGVYTVTLTASCLGCDSAEATDTLQVRVLELDLIVDGLAEESDDKSSGPNEEMPGAFAVLNDDDDNDNDTDDLDESGQIEGEDDLVEAKIEFDREAEDGELRLEASAGGDKILVWTTETKEELVELPKTWDLSDGDVDVPEAVWLEAVSGSTELRDIELMLVFEAETVTEPIEDMVALTSLALEFDVAPRDEEGGSDGSLGVSADAGEMTLAAAVFVRSLEDPEEFLPVEDGAEVEWDVEGDGNTGGTSVTENGIAGTTLSLGGDAGIRGQGIARLTKFAFGEGDDRTEVEVTVERRTAQLEIFPGEAAEIELDASSFVVAADDTDVVELTATIRDEAGNEVSDGTPVSWFSERSDSPFLSTETQTAGGIARATLKASLLPGTVDVYVQAGLAERREEISFEALTAALSSSDSVLTLEGGAPIEISLSTNASDGTPVEWSTSNGTVGLQSTVSGGQTRTILNSTGATPGPVVVTATIGTKLATWTGEARQFGEFSIFVKDRFLTAGRDENSLDIFTRPDGTQSLVPINGRTEVEVVGIPGSTVQVLGSGVEIAEAYNFEALDDNGDVPGLVGGLPIVLNGGQLDDALAFTGESSLLIQEQDSGVVPYSDALALDRSRRVGLSIYPGTFSGDQILAQGTAFEVFMRADRRLVARVETTGGSVEVATSGLLAQNAWQRVEVATSTDLLELRFGNEVVTAPLPAPPVSTTSSLVVARDFAGHIDDLYISVATTQVAEGYEIVGVDAAGLVRLDASGRATIEFVGRPGFQVQEFSAMPCQISVDGIFGSPATVAAGSLKGAQDKVLLSRAIATIFLADEETQKQVLDIIQAFFGGDPETTAGTIANIAGGVLIVGDIGAIVKNLWRLMGFSEKDPNYPELVLSTLGLLTEFAVGAGELLDVPISAAKAIVARVAALTGSATSAFTNFLAKRLKDLVLRGELPSAAEVSLLNIIRTNDDVIRGANEMVTSPATWDGLINVCRKFDGVSGLTTAPQKAAAHTQVISQLTATFTQRFGARAIARSTEVLGLLKPDTIQQLANSGRLSDSLEGLGKMMSLRGANGDYLLNVEQMRKLLDSDFIYSPNYGPDKVLDGLRRMDQVPGVDILVRTMGAANASAKGFRYELEVALFLKGNGGVAFAGRRSRNPILGDPTRRTTDIDVVTDSGLLVQAKRSRKAFDSPRFENWVDTALLETTADKIRVAVPGGAATVPKKFRDFLRKRGIRPEQIIDVPHKN